MSRRTVWIAGGLIVAIGVLAYMSYHQAPAVRDAAGTLVAAPFVHHADMRNWLADGERGLWIQAGNLEWFYARFSEACHGVNSTNSLVFDTPSSGNIDRKTSVVVPGSGRCTLEGFAPSSGPPRDRNDAVVPEPQEQ